MTRDIRIKTISNNKFIFINTSVGKNTGITGIIECANGFKARIKMIKHTDGFDWSHIRIALVADDIPADGFSEKFHKLRKK